MRGEAMMSRPTVLVVDDESDLVELLTDWLEADGYEVHSATDGVEGITRFFDHQPDLTVVDLRMRGMDGFQLIARIREASDAHILVLTGLETEEAAVRGLGLGADAHLVKPVRRRPFLARVQALLRRAVLPEGLAPDYTDAVLVLNFLTHEAHVRGDLVSLRPTEFRLLAYLCRDRDRVVAHSELLDRVWGERRGSLDSLKWYIRSLREKVEADPSQPSIIVTVQAVGYRYLPAERNRRLPKREAPLAGSP